MDKYEKSAIRLIDRLYKDLYLEDDVIRAGSGNKFDKFYNIKAYIDYLENSHRKIIMHKHMNLLKQLYYDKYVIKEKDIPESYYIHQEELALEKGYGYIRIDRKKKAEEIINNQKSRLDLWLNYFCDEESNIYPFWVKYWAFQGILRIGAYDSENGTFNKRTKYTVEPFIELNSEALSISIDMIIKMFNKEKIDDVDLELLVKSGSFQKIYTHVLKKISDNNKMTDVTDGRWVKYEKFGNYKKLVKSLQGYNTGWCTAGESTAKEQLCMGDFYVYYTLDENNEYKVPRVAIRMKGNNIAEVCGVINIQDVEPELVDIVSEKIKKFSGNEKYFKKINDMKTLTLIYKKHKNRENLSKSELAFLYEVNDKIMGFGKIKDPRIYEVIRERNSIAKDISYVLDGIEYFEGSLNLKELKSSKGLKLPKKISGSLDLSGLTNIDELELPDEIGGNLDLRNLSNFNKLKLPKYVGGNLNLHSLKNCDNLVLPETIGGNLSLSTLKRLNNIVFPTTIGGGLDLNNVVEIENSKLPLSVGGSFELSNFIYIENLIFPEIVGGALDLYSVVSIKNSVLPLKVGGTLNLRNLKNIENSKLPRDIGGNLTLNSLKSSENLDLPENIGGILDLRGLINVKNLKLSRNIGGNVILSSLTNMKGIVLPDSFDYKIYLKRFNVTSKNLFLFNDNKLKRLLNYKNLR